MLKLKFPFPHNWEIELQQNLLRYGNSNNHQRIYICSPCRGKDYREIMINMMGARFYMYFVWLEMKKLAKGPHGYMPMLFCDDTPSERSYAMEAGSKLLSGCKGLFVCGDRISEGMKSEIIHAARHKIPITIFKPELEYEVNSILEEARIRKRDVRRDFLQGYSELSLSPQDLFEEVGGSG